MRDNIAKLIRRKPIAAFYILAFAISWLGWVPQAAYSHGLFPFNSPAFYVFGGVGPLAAALIVARVLYGRKDGEEVFGSLLRWRVGTVWYVTAIFGSAAVMLAAAALGGDLRLGLNRLTPSLTMVTVFLTYLLAAIPEEVAWRGFVLPRLQSRYNALVSSLTIGVFWAIWHIPLLLIKGSTMASYSLLPYFIGVIADSIIYTWLYNSSGGSVLMVTIFHAVGNTLGPNIGVEQTIVVIILAAIITIVFGPARLSSRKVCNIRKDSLDIT